MAKNNPFKDWDAAKVAEHNARVNGKEIKKPTAKKKRVGRKSKLEQDMLLQLEQVGVDGFVAEYKWHSVRMWRFDFAHPDLKIAVECEGLTHDGKGRHQNMNGMSEDCRKYNEAAAWDWVVLRFTQPMIKTGEAVELIQRVILRRASAK